VIGVRPSTDVDLTLKSPYRSARYGRGVTHLTPVVDIVTAGYHRSRQRAAISDDRLIESPDYHFMFRGFKFANPDLVLDQKEYYRRDKDLRDIEMAAQLASASAPAWFNPSFALAVCTETLIREHMGGAPPPSPKSGRFGDSRRLLLGRVTQLRYSLQRALRRLARGIRRRVKAVVGQA
jgi:hypothetical protein